MRKSGLIQAALIAIGLLFGPAPDAGAQQPAAEPPVLRFSVLADLRARHPAVASSETFTTWLKQYGISRWHETFPDKELVTVVVQALKEPNLFAAQLKIPGDGSRRNEKMVQALSIDPKENNRSNALRAANETIRKDVQQAIHAIRPVVKFLSGSKYELRWEIELASTDGVEIFEFDAKGIRPGAKAKRALRTIPRVAPAAIPDDLSSNELHHPADFLAEATEWTKGATSVQDKAKRIFENMRKNYRYDSTIVDIDHFTWSDLLVRDTNGRAGICDEWAVVQVTYLRALKIPARLKLILWKEAGVPKAHSALEYSDGGKWLHLDSLWDAFNDPAVYRVRGNATDVTVLDADEPLDSRSTVDAWGSPDLPGDGKLHPYYDFKLAPNIPGNARPGYSN